MIIFSGLPSYIASSKIYSSLSELQAALPPERFEGRIGYVDSGNGIESFRSSGIVWDPVGGGGGDFPRVLEVASFAGMPAPAVQGDLVTTLDNGWRYEWDGSLWLLREATVATWGDRPLPLTLPSGAGLGTGAVLRVGTDERVYVTTAPLALPGGGTARFWVPPEVAAGSPVVRAYMDGTETSDADVIAHGFGSVGVGAGDATVTYPSAGVVRLTAPAGGTTLRQANLYHNGIGWVSTSSRVYMSCSLRASVTAITSSYVGMFSIDTANALLVRQGRTTGLLNDVLCISDRANTVDLLPNGGSAVPGLVSAPEHVDLLSVPPAGAVISSLRRSGGAPYASARRNVSGTGGIHGWNAGASASASAETIAEISEALIISY